MVNASGQIISQSRYLPFGELLWEDGASPTDYTYTGQRSLSDIGLMDYNARFYDPMLGRFTSPDSIVPDPGSVVGYNRYAYVNNNPMIYTDPSGHIIAEDIDWPWERGYEPTNSGNTYSWDFIKNITNSGNTGSGSTGSSGSSQSGDSSSGSDMFEIPGAPTIQNSTLYGNPATYSYTTYKLDTSQIQFAGRDLMVRYTSPIRTIMNFGMGIAQGLMVAGLSANLEYSVIGSVVVEGGVEAMEDAMSIKDPYEEIGFYLDELYDIGGHKEEMIIVIIEQSYVHTIDNSVPYGNSYGDSQYFGVYMEPVGSSISRQVWVRNFYKADIKKYFENLQKNH